MSHTLKLRNNKRMSSGNSRWIFTIVGLIVQSRLRRLREFSTLVAVLSFICVSTPLYAESGRADYDVDDDGLIEINDVNDFYAIRNSSHYFRGYASIYESSLGCPDAGCIGYELTVDLDFQDSNLVFPVNHSFSDVFEGNGHWIRNYTLSPDESVNGLFSQLLHAQVRNLKLEGGTAGLYGYSNIGGLAGIARNSLIENVEFGGQITTAGISGGLVGYASDSQFYNNRVSMTVAAHPLAPTPSTIGGIVGNSENSMYIANQATMIAHGDRSIGGILGASLNDTVESCMAEGAISSSTSASPLVGLGQGSRVRNSYSRLAVETIWAAEVPVVGVSGILHEASYELPRDWGLGDTAHVTDLCETQNVQVPGEHDALHCFGDLFMNWAIYSYVDDNSQLAWRFYTSGGDDIFIFLTGGESEVDRESRMVYVIGDVVKTYTTEVWQYATFPQLFTALHFPDSDYDGVLDRYDAFPLNGAAAIDTDFDGRPDSWIDNCDLICQANSGLDVEIEDDTVDDNTPIEEPGEEGGSVDLYFWLLIVVAALAQRRKIVVASYD